MTGLPNPFTDSGALTASSPDEAAAAPSPRSQAAAADLQQLLAEIANEHRFVLDERAFMDAIEPPPLFLQRTG